MPEEQKDAAILGIDYNRKAADKFYLTAADIQYPAAIATIDRVTTINKISDLGLPIFLKRLPKIVPMLKDVKVFRICTGSTEGAFKMSQTIY